MHWFRRAVGGGFEPPRELLLESDTPLDAGDASCVFPCDWDGDEFPDLLIGNMDGPVQVALGVERDENTGAPRFTPLQPVRAVDGPVTAPSGDSAPVLADWDGDGIRDLLLGHQDGSVTWRRNVAREGVPRLGPEETLITSLSWGETRPGRSDKRVKLDVADWNADGTPDLIVGDFSLRDGPPADEARYAAAFERAKQAERALGPWYARQRERAEELYGGDTEEAFDGERWAAASKQALAELEAQAGYVAAMKAHLEATEELSRVDTKLEEAGRVWVYLRREGQPQEPR